MSLCVNPESVLCSFQFYSSPGCTLLVFKAIILGAHLSGTGHSGWSAWCGRQNPWSSGKSSVFLRSLLIVGNLAWDGAFAESVISDFPASRSAALEPSVMDVLLM